MANSGGEGSEADPFLVGVAISVYQNSGGPGTNWEAFEDQKTWLGSSVIRGGGRCGKSSDFWNNYEADIARVAALNSNSFRLSLEWSRIEPNQGQTCPEGVERYHAIFDCLKRHKLKPCVTLHHFAHPLWFEKLGGFEKEQNVKHFVRFAQTAFREFGMHADMWATFNEVNVATFCGYIYGHFPPARLANFTLAGHHFLNMLRAHTQAYDAIKQLPGGREAKIGFVHNFLEYECQYPQGWAAYYIQPVCSTMQTIWANQAVVDYFRTGVFDWSPPFGSRIHYIEREKPGCDWIGVNYYGRIILDWKFSTTCLPGEKMTDMPFPLHAPGLYRACTAMSKIGVPIYITETGVPDSRDVLRNEMFSTYFAEVERLVRDGIDLRGVFYWTLTDNWEWAQGFHEKFGLYRWSPGDGTQRREVPSTRNLAKIFATLPAKIQDIKSV